MKEMTKLTTKIELLDCPFCKCKPFISWSREDDYSIVCHCPGCGVTMTEKFQSDDEEESDAVERISKKWNLRDELLGININNLIENHNDNMRDKIIMVAEKRELFGKLVGYDVNPPLDLVELHQDIMFETDMLQKRCSVYKTMSKFYVSMIFILAFILYKVMF